MEPCVQLRKLLENKMKRETILYISDQTTCSDAISAALNAAGYEVVTTNTTEAIAMLYILHSIAAVVLRAREQAGFDVRSIRAICPDVPIVFLCRDQIDGLPSRVGAFVSTAQQFAGLAVVVRRLVSGKPATRCPRR
jgi:DNA-binding NtrC family response regulator